MIYQVPNSDKTGYFYVAANLAATAQIKADNREWIGRSTKPFSERSNGLIVLLQDEIPIELVLQLGSAMLPGLE